jgi:hypothetical protein
VKIKEAGTPCTTRGGECIEPESQCNGQDAACHATPKVFILFLFLSSYVVVVDVDIVV